MSATTLPRIRGHRRPLDNVQRDLAEAYIPLARGLAVRFKLRWPDEWKELDSAALLAVCEAAQSWDPDRGVSFSNFARRRIVGSLLDVVRRTTRHSREEPGSHEFDEGSGAVLHTTPDPDPAEVLAESDDFEAWMRLLPARHAEVCRLIYRDGCNQARAAERLGYSQSRISFIHREAVAMLNGTFGDRPYAQDLPLDEGPAG